LSVIEHVSKVRNNPLEVIKAMAGRNGWPLEDDGEDEIALLVKGKHANYQIFFTWMRDLELFHLACSFEMLVPELRKSEVQQLIGRINEQLWLGHFDLWLDEGTIFFRQSLLLVGGANASMPQCEVMLGTALDLCERYYPAFQFVLANGSAVEAIEAARFETAGEA
jgi:hypothetical protein